MEGNVGLYHSEMEKDACGVGFICNIQAIPSHKIISHGRSILTNMAHRGAVIGSHPADGDGAGVMTAIPHEIFSPYLFASISKTLKPNSYGVGNIFMDRKIFKSQMDQFESFAKLFDLEVVTWRRVPVSSYILGPVSAASEPVIFQPFIQSSCDNLSDLESRLYLLRKISGHKIGHGFYTCSLSSKSIVYKGQMSATALYDYYEDLINPLFMSHFCLVHSRFSTNTFPSWSLAQPLRNIAHNGEINTIKGNRNWIKARENGFSTSLFSKDTVNSILPIIEPKGSDSSSFDNVFEFITKSGDFEFAETIMMMIPEAWENDDSIRDSQKHSFYEWAACMMEPWDGPALVVFCDGGRYMGTSLDRNGLRPCRYYLTDKGNLICASEVGTLPHIPPQSILEKGRLEPGKLLVVDFEEKRIIPNDEIKSQICNSYPYRRWIKDNLLMLNSSTSFLNQGKSGGKFKTYLDLARDPRLVSLGYTHEQLSMILEPMLFKGKEGLGSMGNDAALACLSDKPRLTYDFFRQLFAQVTNPPIDPIREDIVMSLDSYVGPRSNLFQRSPEQCRRLKLSSPILNDSQMYEIRNNDWNWTVQTIDITINIDEDLKDGLQTICTKALSAVDEDGAKILVLSDVMIGESRIAIPTIMAVGAVHHYLINAGKRSRVALMVESGDVREVHHFCVLLGFGVDAIYPYLALEIGDALSKIRGVTDVNTTFNYTFAIEKGIKKVMSKMGISTLQSYRGAQIFETLGFDADVVGFCFPGTINRITGFGFHKIKENILKLHKDAYNVSKSVSNIFKSMGEYHLRVDGEKHVNSSIAISELQDAVRRSNQNAYEKYSAECHSQIKGCTLRGNLDFRFDAEDLEPVPLDEVEPWTKIVKRFCTGAMSYGSISFEAHSTLARAMNEMGGKSNSGEGGEEADRSMNDTIRSSIKQIASGRFGVNSYYLASADELQIKMAQGAKPGEGGELPGHKVTSDIARTRKSTPGVGLISPPPHHDIYSIEDLKQLIFDLKSANPQARISVKLVSEIGVGVVASGVVKAKADHILISGHDGGTGAASWTGIKYAGLPWELGLAEAHQTLLLNGIRGRVVLQTDGQLKTGRDVAIACLLGAEEWAFATAPLIALGCTMMRKCHLNTCPVGIATQDPVLRKKFQGKPDHVINFFHYVAEELRSIMAKLGFRTIEEMVGRVDLLHSIDDRIDLGPLLVKVSERPLMLQKISKNPLPVRTLEDFIIEEAEKSISAKSICLIKGNIINTDRAVGTTLSYQISKRYGEAGLLTEPLQKIDHNTQLIDGPIKIKLVGSAGQSFAAFLAPGVFMELEGDANDYVGKGLSGGSISIYPPRESLFASEKNVIAGNACLYGAISGVAYFRGIVAERFAVRNSGAIAVVEGAGDHACEYMTGGRAVFLGSTGRNFGAGMSGGIAYVFDEKGDFSGKCNLETVSLTCIDKDGTEKNWLWDRIIDFHERTGSIVAKDILDDWDVSCLKFKRVLPNDYAKVLQSEAAQLNQTILSNNSRPMDSVRENPDSMKENLEPKNNVIPDIEDSILIVESKEDIKKNGFMRFPRQSDNYRAVHERVKDWSEVSHRLEEKDLKVQSARCMDCGVPFCQTDTGCPLSNRIPTWNDLVFQNRWKDALHELLATNNFPEFTGRVCPAPCEGACVLGGAMKGGKPVSIKSIECAIIDRGFSKGWIQAEGFPILNEKGKKVAVIGSGPAGLAAADELSKMGYRVTVYERSDRIGGLLMYGIPNMKLDKSIVDRRVKLMERQGVNFQTNAWVGKTIKASQVKNDHDAVVLAIGATIPRDLNIPNRQLGGIHFAMEFLEANTRTIIDSTTSSSLCSNNPFSHVAGKRVIVIGGGDTGTDCIATCVRLGAASIVNFELLPQPPNERCETDNPWPQYPRVFKVDYGHVESTGVFGKDPREYLVCSQEFVANPENLNMVGGVRTIQVEWKKDAISDAWRMNPIPGSERFFEADIVLLALGFQGPDLPDDLMTGFDIEKDISKKTISSKNGKYHVGCNNNNVFAAGDCRRGQSLVVWAIEEGRKAAQSVDLFLSGNK